MFLLGGELCPACLHHKRLMFGYPRPGRKTYCSTVSSIAILLAVCIYFSLLTSFFFLCFVSVSKLPNLSQKSNVAERLQYYKESWTFRNTFLLSMPQSLSKIIHQMRSKRWGLLKTCLSTIAKFILFLV